MEVERRVARLEAEVGTCEGGGLGERVQTVYLKLHELLERLSPSFGALLEKSRRSSR